MSSIWFVLRFGWPYLLRYRARLLLGIGLGLAYGMVAASFPWSIGVLVSRLTGQTDQIVPEFLDPFLPLTGREADFPQILGCMFFLPGLILIRGVLGYLSGYFLKWLNEHVSNDLRFDVMCKLHTLSMGYFHRAQTGDLLTRINADTKNLYRAINLSIADLVKEPIAIFSIITVLLWMDWQLTAFILLILPACILPMIILGKKVRAAGLGSRKAEVKQTGNLVEAFHNIRIIKAFGLETYQQARFQKFAGLLIKHNMRANRASELINPIIELAAGLVLSAVFLFVFITQRPIESLAAFIAGMVLFFNPIKKLARISITFQKARASIDRLKETFDEKSSVPEPPNPRPLAPFSREIQVEVRNFSYEAGGLAALRNLSLTIRKGEKLGIAGESGSGKSSLLNLLLRFYDPMEGFIKIDGMDFREVSSKALREQMALVSQDILLFDATVAENIALGRLGATREEIEAAARSAFAHDFILALPQGYDTPIGEKGIRLSGGQKQRISIARAFVRNAPILILDEATAALDAKSEEEVQKAIDTLSENRTVICVAHRLSTLRQCDRIVVLHRGEIVEEGTFHQLLERRGYFAVMAERQSIALEKPSLMS